MLVPIKVECFIILYIAYIKETSHFHLERGVLFNDMEKTKEFIQYIDAHVHMPL